jgi:hypothetical protein
VQQALEEVGTTFVADGETAVAKQPRQGPLDLPAVTAQPLAGLHAAASDPRADPTTTERPSAGRIVVAFVAVQLDRALAGPPGASSRPDNRWDGIDQLFQQLRVMGVGRRQARCQRDAASVDHQVILGSWLAPVDRIRANEFPPRRARTLTESIAARDQSS